MLPASDPARNPIKVGRVRTRPLPQALPLLHPFPLPETVRSGAQMDLHRAAFKMESSSYLPNPLASPALMVLASTAEASRDASIPCQPPRPFGVPASVEKDVHLPFTNGSYTFASMYHRQGAVPSGFPNRDFPPSLLHLHHQFAPPSLDCSPISMLNHSGVGAFRPFASPPEERDGGGYQSAFTPAKRLKGCLEAEASPHLRYSDAEGKEYDYGGTQIPSSSPGALKVVVEDAGKKIFAVSGLLSDREPSSSPEDRIERYRVRRGPRVLTRSLIAPWRIRLGRPRSSAVFVSENVQKSSGPRQLFKHVVSFMEQMSVTGTAACLLFFGETLGAGEAGSRGTETITEPGAQNRTCRPLGGSRVRGLGVLITVPLTRSFTMADKVDLPLIAPAFFISLSLRRPRRYRKPPAASTEF
ncbi:hypothetical protein GJAV_G00120250 [Gymnothorax javanicus]|nr:hypothetical protein GJAV_G00120250 [Gymnothorax javanicus]